MSMAKGAEAEEFVVLSEVRTGLKREFAFALKSQYEIAASLGRTRTRRSASCVSGVLESSSCKKFKKSSPISRANGGDDSVVGEGGDIQKLGVGGSGGGSGKADKGEKMVVETEGDLNSDVVDGPSDDDCRSQLVESLGVENSTDVTVVASDDEQKSCSDTSKGNTDVAAMEEAIVGMPQILTSVNANSEEIHDVPVEEHDFTTPDKPARRLTQPALMSIVEETKDLSINGRGEGKPSSDSPVAMNVGELSSKSLMKTIPRKLKELLDTGLLEGLSVSYIRWYKGKLPTENGLRGMVKGTGILCFCQCCKGVSVVTPTVFELHAGSSNKRPTDYICLANGNTFRDVLNACKECKLDDLNATIRKAIGQANEGKTADCINCKESIYFAGKKNAREFSDTSMELKASQNTPKSISKASKRPQEKLVHKSSIKAKKSESSGNKSDGRLTRKDLRLHKLVFEGDVLPDGTEVGYYVRGKKMLSGYKQGSGIVCMCCQKEVSPSQFEAHAGWASSRKPYLHIYTSNGVSLHELSLSLSRSRKLSSEDNDDLCSICSQRGNLLCCDGCPRVFHKECIPLPEVPDGDWFCKNCQSMFEREKYAECNANAIAAGRVAGVDPIEQIKRRCIRIMKPQESESACALCRAHDFATGGFGCRTVMLCDQCEREFHVGCLQDHGMQDLKELPKGKWFCCSGCDRIYSVLQQMIEDGEQQIPDCVLNVIRQKHEASDREDVKLDVKWRLLNGKMSSVANIRALLSEAVSVFHEQFDPIVLPDSNQDIIPHMVYGRNVKDKELGGMYCAVLTVNSVIVSAGVFRVLGKDIAELPLVATSSGCEKLGYFRVLYSCIEKLLGELDVNYLWLPAADEAKPLWTNKFGFSDFPADVFVELEEQYSLMIFDGTRALRKSIPRKHDLSQDLELQVSGC